jgi:hypothetical protein
MRVCRLSLIASSVSLVCLALVPLVAGAAWGVPLSQSTQTGVRSPATSTPTWKAIQRDHVYVDLLTHDPLAACGDWEDVAGPSRITNIWLTASGTTLSSTAKLAEDYCGVKRLVSARSTGLLVTDLQYGILTNWSTSGRRALRTWRTGGLVVDADSATATRTVVALVNGPASLRLMAGTLDTPRWRTVRSWKVASSGLRDSPAVVLTSNGATAYVALPYTWGTALQRVNLRTGTQTTLRSLVGRWSAGLDLTPNGRYLAVIFAAAATSFVAPVSMITTSGRGSFTIRVDIGSTGQTYGPDGVAFSADSTRLYLAFRWHGSLEADNVTADWTPGHLMVVRACAACGANAHLVPTTSPVSGRSLAVLRP